MDGFPGALCFSINPADYLCFDTLFQYVLIPPPVIQKIANACPVILAGFFHLNGLSLISHGKHTQEYRHDVPQYDTPIMLSQFQLQEALVYCGRIIYTVPHKTSLLFVIVLLVDINSI